MTNVFVIGDREKNEWVSVFDNEKKALEFKNELAGAKTYPEYLAAKIDLSLMQATGFFGDLQVYLVEEGLAYRAGERDSFQP